MTLAESAATDLDALALAEKERRIQELKSDLDKAHDLIQRQDEQIQDFAEVIERWKEAFGMVFDDKGLLTWNPFVAQAESWRDRYNDLLRKWNRFVGDYTATVRRRNVGRPLAASDAQRETVLRLRGAGKSLRTIADETNLGLNTVRTIVDQGNRPDRTSMKHLERIRRDMGEEREWQSRKRARESLPRRIAALQDQAAELHKEAKGLK
jgi:regulator of protease activity HflC (stomatin/prohibitin superfamily)